MSITYTLSSTVSFPVALWIDYPKVHNFQGCPIGPFKIYLYTEDNETHRVDLYVQGSASIPYQVPQNKWSHLNPQWELFDLSGNNINDITFTNAVTTIFNGTTGYLASSEFFLIDDMPTTRCDTRFVWATLDVSQYPVYKEFAVNQQSTPGYANSKVFTAAPYLVNELTPTYLDITRDGINSMLDFYWINASIPHVVSIVGTSPYTSCSAIMKNVPSSNLFGLSAGVISRTIVDIPSTYLNWVPETSESYLSAFDDQDFRIGGYLKGKVVSDITANNINISAYGNVYYKNIPFQYPFLWISNPENNTLNRIFAPCIPDEWTPDDLPFYFNVADDNFDVSNLQLSSLVDVMALTGFNGIYGIAIDGETKDIWCTDAESDKVYKFNLDGVLLSSFNFPGISGSSTPAGISIDGVSGVWVTFYNAASVICIDKNTGVLKDNINLSANYIPYEDNIIAPVLSEPDYNNDIWITLNNTLCCSLLKYDTTIKNIIATITLPACSNPMDIFVTKDNDVWVTLSRHSGPPYIDSKVEKYNGTTFCLISSFPALNPAYLAMDNQESVWYTESGNCLTRITSSGDITHWTIGMPNTGINSPAPLGIVNDALEGICCDECDKIWIINSVENQLYTITNKDDVVPAIKILPDQNLAWYNDRENIYTEISTNNKSAQAFGDWSGNRWMRKYSVPYYTPQLLCSLQGKSNNFNIYNFTGYDIRRFNENWDASNEIHKFARSPHIADNPVLWDEYMKAVWGDTTSLINESFGREAYEKISNFTPNHIDINVCNVDQLYNLARNIDVPIDNYGITLPVDLKRIMDIGSINQQYLWGSRCKCNKNIENEYTTYISGGQLLETNYTCKYCGHQHPGNKGDLFNPLTYVVTSYIPFILENKTDKINRYILINPPLLTNTTTSNFVREDICIDNSLIYTCLSTYPLSSYYNIILPPVFTFSLTADVNEFLHAIDYFCFYDYIYSSPCNEQIAGVINWDDKYTTLDETLSSIDTWYGNGQTLERIINYVLHKGLGLIKE